MGRGALRLNARRVQIIIDLRSVCPRRLAHADAVLRTNRCPGGIDRRKGRAAARNLRLGCLWLLPRQGDDLINPDLKGVYTRIYSEVRWPAPLPRPELNLSELTCRKCAAVSR